MKRFLCVLAICLAVAAVSAAADDVVIQGVQLKLVPGNKKDNIDKDKIVGVWEAKEVAPGLPEGKWEFKKDGTVELSVKLDPKNIKFTDQNGNNIQFPADIVFPAADGKYEIKGNKLTVTMTNKLQGNKEITHKVTITKLTDKELQTKDEKGKVITFKKK